MIETRDKRRTIIRALFVLYLLSPAILYAILALRKWFIADLSSVRSVDIPFGFFFFFWLIAFPLVAAVCALIEIVGRAIYESKHT